MKSQSTEPLNRPFRDEHELAAYLNQSVSTLRRWRARRIGPAFTKPAGTKKPRYPIADTDAWIASGRVEQRAAR